MAHQPSLPGIPPPKRAAHITNVASVPQRSPFRFPGGKTWLIPHIRRWLHSLPNRPEELIEPFAGGGIVGLTAGFEDLAAHVTLVELDEEIAAVWQTILSDDALWLGDAIAHFGLTPDNVEALLAKKAESVRERALQTIVKNRVNRGGILAAGAGRLKEGENGRGIRSRWYPDTLKKRILHIGALQDRFTFIHGDGLAVLRENAHRPGVAYFIDPPYTAGGKRAGARLYTYADVDHEALFQVAAALAGDFLMTYDNTEEVWNLARRYGFEGEPIAMKSTHHAAQTELLIGRDLGWIRR